MFYGLYGSGKSEIAINYAISLASLGRAVSLVDLDAVTPYFRIRDVEEVLSARGVRVISPKDSIRYADLPVLPVGIRRVFSGGDPEVVVDLGGDPTGARVLGGLGDALSQDSRGLFVVNFNRPFTRTVEEAARAVDMVSSSAGLEPCGVVSNTHLGALTEVSHVAAGFGLAQRLGRKLGLPVEFVGVAKSLLEKAAQIEELVGKVPLLWLQRFLLKPWEAGK